MSIVERIRHISVLGNNLVADFDVLAADVTAERCPGCRESNAFPETHLDCWELGLPGLKGHRSQSLNHGRIGVFVRGTRVDGCLNFVANSGHPLRVERKENEDPGGVDT